MFKQEACPNAKKCSKVGTFMLFKLTCWAGCSQFLDPIAEYVSEGLRWALRICIFRVLTASIATLFPLLVTTTILSRTVVPKMEYIVLFR